MCFHDFCMFLQHKTAVRCLHVTRTQNVLSGMWKSLVPSVPVNAMKDTWEMEYHASVSATTFTFPSFYEKSIKFLASFQVLQKPTLSLCKEGSENISFKI